MAPEMTPWAGVEGDLCLAAPVPNPGGILVFPNLITRVATAFQQGVLAVPPKSGMCSMHDVM